MISTIALFAAALFAVGVALAVAAEASDGTEVNAYLLAEQPKDAAEVIAIRNDAKDQQEVVVVGRIGGRANPWIKGAPPSRSSIAR